MSQFVELSHRRAPSRTCGDMRKIEGPGAPMVRGRQGAASARGTSTKCFPPHDQPPLPALAAPQAKPGSDWMQFAVDVGGKVTPMPFW